MGVGARVFKGACTPAEKRAKSRNELEPAYYRKRSAGVYTVRRKRASVASLLIGSIFNDVGYGWPHR